MTAKRKRFAKMEGCPVRGCRHFEGKPRPTVVGVKRHVRALHADVKFDRIKWPSIYPQRPGKGVADAIRGSGSKKKVAESASV